MIERYSEVSNNHKVDSLFTFDFEEIPSPYYILTSSNKFCNLSEEFFYFKHVRLIPFMKYKWFLCHVEVIT